MKLWSLNFFFFAHFKFIPEVSDGIYCLWFVKFYVSLTVQLIAIFVNNQLDAQFIFLYLFIPILCMF